MRIVLPGLSEPTILGPAVVSKRRGLVPVENPPGTDGESPSWASSDGGLTCRLQRCAVDLLCELVHLGGELHHLLSQVGVLLKQRQRMLGQVFPCGIRVGPGLVSLCLPGLCQKDEWRSICRLEAECEVQQDEGVRVEIDEELEPVEDDPRDDNDRLGDEVLRGPEEAGDPLGKGSEPADPNGEPRCA